MEATDHSSERGTVLFVIDHTPDEAALQGHNTHLLRTTCHAYNVYVMSGDDGCNKLLIDEQ